MNQELNLLPLGTVVLLKNGKKKVMITGYYCMGQESEGKVFDYSGCMYPEGVINSEKTLMFNHENIDKVFYVGYTDSESEEFSEHLKEIRKAIDENLKES